VQRCIPRDVITFENFEKKAGCLIMLKLSSTAETMRTLSQVFVLLVITACVNDYHSMQEKGFISFHLNYPEAKEVHFLSSLDNFQRHQAVRNPEQEWVVTVPASSEFQYIYLVDGTIFLPDCAVTVEDDFGYSNCLFLPTM
jgi:hypothetical protein